jgi:hypothetical protein
MNKVLIFVCVALLTGSVSAQNQLGESARDVTARNSRFVITEQGYVPRNLADLVEATPIIVRGTYGPILNHRMDLGEGRTADQLAQQLKIPIEQARTLGMPIVTYQFDIAEVIKGSGVVEEEAKSLEMEFGESLNALDIFPGLGEFRTGEHLLFLDVASNGVFYLRGPVFDMKLEGNRYQFRYNEKPSTAFGSDNAEAFLREVEELVE